MSEYQYAGKLGPWARNRCLRTDRYLEMDHGRYYKILSAEKTNGAWHYVTVQLEGYEETYPAWCGTNTYILEGQMDEEKMVEIKVDGKPGTHYISEDMLAGILFCAESYINEWIQERSSLTFAIDNGFVEDKIAKLEDWVERYHAMLARREGLVELCQFLEVTR